MSFKNAVALSSMVEVGKKPGRVIFVGNPPYQEEQGQSSALPIYQRFVNHALAHGNDGLFIIPARWYATGKGSEIEQFRNIMLTSGKLKRIVDFPNSRTVFPTVDIASGICYLQVSNSHHSTCMLTDGHGKDHTVDLSQFDIVLREPKAISIIRKIIKHTTAFMDTCVSSQTPFGLITTFNKFAAHSSTTTCTCETKNGPKQVDVTYITRGRSMIHNWKVITSKAGPASGRPDKYGRRTVLSITKVLPPNHVCLQTYIVVQVFDNQHDAQNCATYLTLKLPRFLIAQRAISQHLPPRAWKWTPIMDFTRAWTDTQLYDHFGLTADERAHIEATIR